ncbi:hypothetical protein [Pseudomonas aeruginosa]|uniref:hypothetical protein n=1 Tax=Pseudomonas aeruginosa TaxID=287 RepID=UPI001141F85F|nr:hypothetical protein [Pseudomonas aeruginosa]MBI8815053.1 hypothetical protein [Pseudomonas aeruginosa]MBW6335089.1 hypothetical protein [Pseudomonas aeruginosa]MCJ0610800.1 hypothetical protein [Pseudomonas aeruginosa]MCJ0616705.1 hypothetical protein [Pseudomonas aeruginosa]MCJ0626554.1 hypothetical protein [Pseudomonas aeruginosa]
MTRKTVLIDSCAWNKLWERNVQLLEEQGTDLCFTISTYGEQEIPDPAQETKSENAKAVGAYIKEQMHALQMEPIQRLQLVDSETSLDVGIRLGDLAPDGSVSRGGFLSSVEGRAYVEDPSRHKKIGGKTGSKIKGSGLPSNLTDVDYGEWSIDLGPLVTDNVKDFKDAGNIIDISLWHDGSFGDFVRKQLAQFA